MQLLLLPLRLFLQPPPSCAFGHVQSFKCSYLLYTIEWSFFRSIVNTPRIRACLTLSGSARVHLVTSRASTAVTTC